jgi:hypothetical protein
MNSTRRWRIITPEYGEVVPVTDEGQGPMEYGCDVIEVEAATRRDALVVGVALMRRHEREYHYFRHCDGNPYVGVRVVPVNVAWEAHCETCEACMDGECAVALALRTHQGTETP